MRLAVITLVGLIVAVSAGCGQTKTLDTVPITGKVTLDGTAVEGANVVFAPASGGGTAASGVTGADGSYKLTTLDPDDGALPGKYSVIISKIETHSALDSAVKPGMTAEEANLAARQAKDAAGKAAEPTVKELLPAKYKNPGSSGLTADVAKGGKTEFNWELTSK